MTKLSVNINKIATIRNARNGNTPDVVFAAMQCEKFGTQGITVHPRPDERHIRYRDVYDIKSAIATEFNIEGNPIPPFMELVLDCCPTQVTLVPDAHDAITSNCGWNTIENQSFLKDITDTLHDSGIRVSIFVDANPSMIEAVANIGADRVELYTEPYASMYELNKELAIAPFIEAASVAKKIGLEVNAGHDLSLTNLEYLHEKIPFLSEVSIGHALISDALYLGLEQTIKEYLFCLK